ncbi:MAG: alpha-amylase family glycosyl hydrolase [Clostridia bacterium]|nr:alpha-amylase family glycosyl hydrolase [Clostridia bacterium]
MWFNETVFYHIYPLGFCGAPFSNDGITVPRIKKVADFADHIARLGCGAVYFGPVFESGTHGYDTHDYGKIDCRLGTNEDFANVCSALREKGIKIIVDGVFNHVGRGFAPFLDVKEKKWNSPYKDWFNISFDGNSCYNDGFWYEGWEGHYELVKLNLCNPDVRAYLIENVGKWIDEYGIDGLRLDVAYMLNMDFMRELSAYCKQRRGDFFLLGEMIHGDYNRLMPCLDSVTNYECYKGLYSSFNSMNMFEIAHSLGRQFGSENWCLYRGRHLASFADNHDVSRIASTLTRKEHLKPLYGLMFAMPGIPFIYYGSEWGAEGCKRDGDTCLRPSFDAPKQNELTEFISKVAKIKNESRVLAYGGFKAVHITNKQLVFEREFEGERLLCAVNADESAYRLPDNTGVGAGYDLLSDDKGASLLVLPPFSVRYIAFK